MIPITKPYLGDEEKRACERVLHSGWLTQGPEVTRFEEMVAARLGVKYAIACSNCTTALHISLEVLGIGPGDEVLVPSYTYIATPNSVVHVGARPVFVDIDLETYNVSPQQFEKTILENYNAGSDGAWTNKKTGGRLKGVITVDQIGMPVDMDGIFKLAEKYRLKIVQDAACAIGSQYKGRPVGAHGYPTCFSFHPRKIITTGEGGMITTNDEEFAKEARILISHGATVSDVEKHSSNKVVFESFPVYGYNYRLSNIQGALGAEQMSKLDDILSRRRHLAKRYSEAYIKSKNIVPPFIPDYATPSYQSYMVRLADSCPIGQVELMQKLIDAGISSRRGIMACHQEPCYAETEAISLPNTEKALNTTLILPLYPDLKEEDQDYIINKMLELTG